MVEVDFSPVPENCDIEIDGKYVGGSPLKRQLQAGKEYKIRISKGGVQRLARSDRPRARLTHHSCAGQKELNAAAPSSNRPALRHERPGRPVAAGRA